jgi:hypothetical protein
MRTRRWSRAQRSRSCLRHWTTSTTIARGRCYATNIEDPTRPEAQAYFFARRTDRVSFEGMPIIAGDDIVVAGLWGSWHFRTDTRNLDAR